MLFVDTAHERSSRRQDLIDENEDGLLRRELDALADDIYELADSEVGWDQVFLLVDRCDVGFLDFFTDYLDTDLTFSISISQDSNTEVLVVVLTGIRSAYFCRIRSASALRFSKGCSSLNLERMLRVFIGFDRCR